jgi:putative endonuclease
MAFLKRHRLLEHRARFDIIGIVWPSESVSPELTHYADAFRPEGFGQFYE